MLVLKEFSFGHICHCVYICFFGASIHKIPYDIHIFAVETKMMSGGRGEGEWWWIVCDCAACIIVLPKFCFIIDGVREIHLGWNI